MFDFPPPPIAAFPARGLFHEAVAGSIGELVEPDHKMQRSRSRDH